VVNGDRKPGFVDLLFGRSVGEGGAMEEEEEVLELPVSGEEDEEFRAFSRIRTRSTDQ
jgi:hypothetical protein